MFLIFQFLYWFQMKGLGPLFGKTDGSLLPVPLWTNAGVTWFLAALLAWRIVHPIFSLLKHPLAFSVVVGLISPFVEAGYNFMPIFAFWPYFVWGSVTKRETLLGWSNDVRLKAFFFSTALVFIGASVIFPDNQLMMTFGRA